MLFVYVALPEKYLIPSSEFLLQSLSVAKVDLAGAPRFSWNATSQVLSIVATGWFWYLGSGRELATGLRNTTRIVPHGSRLRGTVVRLFAIWKDASSMTPVSACQSSGSLPWMRKVA